MTAIDVQGTSVSDMALALWAENSAISLKLFKTLKQRHQCLPHVAKHSRFPLSPGRQPWPPPRSSALWTYDGTTDS